MEGGFDARVVDGSMGQGTNGGEVAEAAQTQNSVPKLPEPAHIAQGSATGTTEPAAPIKDMAGLPYIEAIAALESGSSETEEDPGTPNPENQAASQQIESPRDQAPIEWHTDECSICIDTLDEDNLPPRNVTGVCEHKSDVCLKCLSEYIRVKINEETPDNIECPKCDQYISFASIKNFAHAATFERYDKILFQRCLTNGLGQGEKFQDCANPECGSGQLYHPAKYSYIVCAECHQTTCIKCDALGHPGRSCDENQAGTKYEQAARQAEAAQSQAFVDTQCKRCPKCKLIGIKVLGCDHIKCPQCGHDYCWVCAADYDLILQNGNGEHRPNCQYRPENLPDFPEGFGDGT